MAIKGVRAYSISAKKDVLRIALRYRKLMAQHVKIAIKSSIVYTYQPIFLW